MPDSLLDRLDLSLDELTDIVDQNPSLRGMIVGYAAEYKLRKVYFSDDRVTRCLKHDDHDRRKKGDLHILYRGHQFLIESKSLQASMVKKQVDGSFVGKVQCDASDRRTISLRDGSKVTTTCLLAGEFDILAANLFAFQNQWQFSFALNRDLPRSKYREYSDAQRKQLLATLVHVSWPVQKPFVEDPFILLDRLVEERT